MFKNDAKKNWGKGIPHYSDSDLMSSDDLYDFALDIVYQYELKTHDCYEVIDANPDKNSMPSFVAKAKGKLIFILVEADLVQKMPTLSEERQIKFIEHCKKFNAEAFYAPVGFGSFDPERFEKMLALKGDSYYANYVGLTCLDGSALPYDEIDA